MPILLSQLRDPASAIQHPQQAQLLDMPRSTTVLSLERPVPLSLNFNYDKSKDHQQLRKSLHLILKTPH